MTINKRKFAYYIFPVIFVCVAAVFVFIVVQHQNNPQESSNMDRHLPLEKPKVVRENKQKQTEERLEKPIADTHNESNENKEATELIKTDEVIKTDDDRKDVDSSTTLVENTIDEDVQQTAPVKTPNNEIGGSEAREIPKLSDVHLRRPHYTKVLDNGTVFDSRKSREVVVPAEAVISGSIADVKKTIRELEKIENKSPALNAYIETLKRFENP